MFLQLYWVVYIGWSFLFMKRTIFYSSHNLVVDFKSIYLWIPPDLQTNKKQVTQHARQSSGSEAPAAFRHSSLSHNFHKRIFTSESEKTAGCLQNFQFDEVSQESLHFWQFKVVILIRFGKTLNGGKNLLCTNIWNYSFIFDGFSNHKIPNDGIIQMLRNRSCLVWNVYWMLKSLWSLRIISSCIESWQ